MPFLFLILFLFIFIFFLYLFASNHLRTSVYDHQFVKLGGFYQSIVVIPWFDGLDQFISHGWLSSGGSSQILMFFYQKLQ